MRRRSMGVVCVGLYELFWCSVDRRQLRRASFCFRSIFVAAEVAAIGVVGVVMMMMMVEVGLSLYYSPHGAVVSMGHRATGTCRVRTVKRLETRADFAVTAVDWTE
jgi:hypothetical protein